MESNICTVSGIVNVLKKATKHIVDNEIVFVGNNPFTFTKFTDEYKEKFFNTPWVIDHPDANDKLFRIISVESNCLPVIHEGMTIGLRVKEWDKIR